MGRHMYTPGHPTARSDIDCDLKKFHCRCSRARRQRKCQHKVQCKNRNTLWSIYQQHYSHCKREPRKREKVRESVREGLGEMGHCCWILWNSEAVALARAEFRCCWGKSFQKYLKFKLIIYIEMFAVELLLIKWAYIIIHCEFWQLFKLSVGKFTMLLRYEWAYSTDKYPVLIR